MVPVTDNDGVQEGLRYKDAMKHFDLSNITIKAEPLSPDSAHHLLTQSATSPPMSTSPITYTDNDLTCPMETGTPTPGVTDPSKDTTKSALKSSILSKRRARGEMLIPSMDDGPRDYKLTKREIERREARKEQNRRAARKCRIKKKRIQQMASQEMQSAIKENVVMKEEVQTLRQQVNDLKKIISDHEKSPGCKLAPFQTLCTDTNPLNTQLLKFPVKSETSSPLPVKYETSSPEPVFPIEVDTTSLSSQYQHYCPTSMGTDHPSQYDLIPLNSYSSSTKCSDSVPFIDDSIPSDLTSINNANVDPSDVEASANIAQTIPSWDLKNLISDLQANPEESHNLDEIINKLLSSESVSDTFETPNGGELTKCINNKQSFSCNLPDEPTPKGCVLNKNIDPKPRVVRNLNRYFTQSNSHDQKSPQQQSIKKNNVSHPLSLNMTPASAFLRDPSLSSPILPCISPNMVQQPPVSVAQSSTNIFSPISDFQPHSEIISSPFNENQPFIQHQVHPDPCDMAQLPSTPQVFSQNSENNEHTPHHPDFNPSSFLNNYSMQSNSYVPPPEAMIDFCSNEDINNNHIHHGSHANGDVYRVTPGPAISPGFTYQLSPVSDTSPGSVASATSPGFLLPYRHDHIFDFEHL